MWRAVCGQILSLLFVFGFTSGSVDAETQDEALARVLRVNEVVVVMRDEGLRYGQTLDADMLGGAGGSYFAQGVERIYDTDNMAAIVSRALADGMSTEDVKSSIAFFDTEQGQRILSLENAARVALADPSVEEIARQTYAELADKGDPRLAAVSQFVTVNDLLERNVAGALSSNYQFYRGLVDGGGFKMGDEEILAEVWSQEGEVREDTDGWLHGFLLMAYQPLQDVELDSYIQFSTTPAGKSLNAALFDGFDEMYRTISYALGRSVAEAMSASDL